MISIGIVSGLVLVLILFGGGVLLLRRTGGRSLLVVAALLGVAGSIGVTLLGSTPRRHRAVLVDASASVVGEWRSYLATDAWRRDLDDDDIVSVWLFGRTAVSMIGPTPSRELPTSIPDSSARAVDPSESRVASALETVLATFDRDDAGEILLVTDGRCDDPAARDAIDRVRAAGLGFDVAAIGERARADVRIVDVRAPRRAGADDRFSVLVTVEGQPGASVAVELQREGDVGSRRRGPFALGPSGRTRVAFEETMPDRDCHGLVRLTGGDPIPENDRRSFRVRLRGRRRALVVAPAGDAGGDLAARALAAARSGGAAAYVVERLVADRVGLAELLRTDPPDLLVFADVSRAELPEAELNEAAADGVGLWFTGSRRAFGPGGYSGGRLERDGVLPLRARADDERAATVVLVVDVSGSMAQSFAGSVGSKAAAAREALAALLVELPIDTRVGLVAFAGTLRIESAPIALDDTDARTELDAAIAGIEREPRGGTEPLAPLRRAAEWLSAAEGRRHLVLVTDGELPADAAPELEAIGARLRDDGVGATVVATGLRERDHALLRPIADPVLVTDRATLVREITERGRGAAGDDEPFEPTAVAGDVAASWLDGWPPIAPTRQLRTFLPPADVGVAPAVPLVVVADDREWPLVALGRWGSGVVVATPASLDDFPAAAGESLVRAVARHIVRRDPGGRVADLDARLDDRGVTLVLEVRDARDRPVEVDGPRLVEGPIFERTGVARWEARLSDGFSDATRFRVVDADGARVVTATLDPPLGLEYRAAGPDARRLRDWASAAGDAAVTTASWDGSWIALALAACLVVADAGRGVFRRRSRGAM